jgi:hypothetical protein
VATNSTAYLGILATAGSLLSLVALCIPLLRFKELRMRRALAVLEWLATNTPTDAEPNSDRFAEEARWLSPLHTWGRIQPLFDSSTREYLRLVWNASLRDLYWVNRFGYELQRLSLFPLPPPRDLEITEHRRQGAVRIHIRDFLIIVNRLFPFVDAPRELDER